jgi:hypothetical protein
MAPRTDHTRLEDDAQANGGSGGHKTPKPHAHAQYDRQPNWTEVFAFAMLLIPLGLFLISGARQYWLNTELG